MPARRIVVSGRVQGVAFRFYTREEAESLGLAGFVRNLRDGRVELVAQGEEAALAALERWCAHGPPAARVDDVAAEDHPVVDGLDAFTIAETV